jgi:hypothetical protein
MEMHGYVKTGVGKVKRQLVGEELRLERSWCPDVYEFGPICLTVPLQALCVGRVWSVWCGFGRSCEADFTGYEHIVMCRSSINGPACSGCMPLF